MNENNLQSFNDTGADIPPENPKNKKILFLVAGVAVGVVAVAGFLFWQTQQESARERQTEEGAVITVQEEPEPQVEEPAAVVEETDTSTWQTYRNDEFGFEVRYPSSWTIQKAEYSPGSLARFDITNPDVEDEYSEIVIKIFENGQENNFERQKQILLNDNSSTITEIFINGTQGIASPYQEGGRTTIRQLFPTKDGSNFFIIDTFADEQYQQTIKQILSAFRFVE